TNLLDNAAKYTPPKGHIAVMASLEENGVVLRVRDTGVGISSEMLPRVFDLFAQGDPSLAHSQGGLGIGLTMVQKLVDLHGGTVTVHSEGLGRGTEVVVRLPLGTRSHTPPEPASEGRVRPSHHILVVEDNPDAREMLRVTLEVDGHRVEVAEDGPQGVAMARSSRPQIVLVDIGLPGLNGYEVARQMRALLGRQVRLIAVTGYGRPEDHYRTEEAGGRVPDVAQRQAAEVAARTGCRSGPVPAAVRRPQPAPPEGVEHAGPLGAQPAPGGPLRRSRVCRPGLYERRASTLRLRLNLLALSDERVEQAHLRRPPASTRASTGASGRSSPLHDNYDAPA